MLLENSDFTSKLMVFPEILCSYSNFSCGLSVKKKNLLIREINFWSVLLVRPFLILKNLLALLSFWQQRHVAYKRALRSHFVGYLAKV